MKNTALSLSPVPLDCRNQVAPPSVVRRIMPFSPTAVPVSVSVNETPHSVSVVPLAYAQAAGEGLHVRPLDSGPGAMRLDAVWREQNPSPLLRMVTSEVLPAIGEQLAAAQ